MCANDLFKVGLLASCMFHEEIILTVPVVRTVSTEHVKSRYDHRQRTRHELGIYRQVTIDETFEVREVYDERAPW